MTVRGGKTPIVLTLRSFAPLRMTRREWGIPNQLRVDENSEPEHEAHKSAENKKVAGDGLPATSKRLGCVHGCTGE